MAGIDHTTFNTASTDTTKALTRVMILHPIASGLAFIAFLLALGAGICGAIFASMVSAVTWLITVVVVSADFALFGIIKNHVNKDGSGSHAYYTIGMWTILCGNDLFVLWDVRGVVYLFYRPGSTERINRASKAGDAGYVGNGTTTTRETLLAEEE